MEAGTVKMVLLHLFLGIGLVSAGGLLEALQSLMRDDSAGCDSPLGMQNGQIPNSALKATTEYTTTYGPSNARLNQGTAWIAKSNDKGQWIQVDFGKVFKVTKIATQGRADASQWVTKFSVSYSVDGGYFKFQKHSPYNVNRVYLANKNYMSVVINPLDQPIVARYIRIHPVEWNGHISMRMEVYGCRSGFPTPQPPACMASLGLENYSIPDSSVTASSEINVYYKASNGRLHLYQSGSIRGGWIAGTTNDQQWFQVNFGNWAQVTRVSTQGRQDAAQWVTKYELCYSYDGVFIKPYKEDGQQPKEFTGNEDQYTVVSHLLKYPTITRYIRIVPIAWYGAIALRADFYGCKSGRYAGGWATQYNDDKQFLQIDLDKVTKITRIATQGRVDAGWWVKTYSLSYSVNGTTFLDYNNGQILQGNTDNTNAEGRILDPPIIARLIKINVKSTNAHPSMRVELFGCKEGFPTPKTPQCMEALGMQTGHIPDSAITALTSANAVSFAPSVGRLHFLSSGSGKYGGWAAGSNNDNQWFQVDFGSWTKISAVATQGRQDADQWVEKYNLAFSYDGVFYETVNDEYDKKIFNANFDRYTVVTNVLHKPIVTRLIRIYPVTWHSHISMRTEFYGCRKGFQPPKVQCTSPLGLENGNIPDSAIVASSRYNQYWGPERGRLNEQKEGSYYGGWAAQYNDDKQFMQIDLGNVTKVTRTATQGRVDAGWWVKTYSLSYSMDGGMFQDYNNKELIQGNTDNIQTEGRILNPPIIARFIKINVKSSNGHPSMRVELYGCREGFATPSPPLCMDALGMQTSQIPDSAITASSSYNAISLAPSVGRLHFLSSGSGKYGSWAAGSNNKNQWFKVDFGSWTKLTAVATQGRQDADQWVVKYSLSFSYDGVFYETVNDEQYSFKKIFNANFDRYTVVRNVLDKPIITRFLKIHPVEWNGHISMRTEFYGCRKGFQPPKIQCASPLGMENGNVPDSAIVASSRYNQYWGPERGRLNEQKEGSYNGGWAAQYNDDKQFLQIDLGKVTEVTRIASQGRVDAGWWVKTYSLSYSVDGGMFQDYNNKELIQGNTDNIQTEGRILNPPIIARFIKINVKSSNGHPSMRVELYGCREGYATPSPPLCMDALGMQTSQIPDSAITASSSYNAISLAPSVGRLHFLSSGSGKYGSWAAGSNNKNQWFKVDFGSWTKLTAVATQGRQDADQWVVKYSLSFSYDGVFYETVNDEQYSLKKIFNANFDRYTVVRNVLDKQIITRFIKIYPVEWNGHISMRTEFYGCRKGFMPPKVVCADALGLESGLISDSALTATSQYSQYWGPERSRLRTKTQGSYGGGWAASSNDIGQWLQIDLGNITKITRVATQGRNDANWWVKNYTLTYSDGGPFKPYKNGEVFQGNMDRNTAEGRILDQPIIARYLRIHPDSWQGQICLRVELFGCRNGFNPGERKECKKILGMQNYNIPDSAISASSYYSTLVPKNARLHYQGSSWSSTANNKYQYLQIDLGGWTNITRVATQGRQNADWWTEKYKLSFGYNGVFFEDYKEEGYVKVFPGNSDRYTVVGHNLKKPIIARFIRFCPVIWKTYMSLRVELYGCRRGFQIPVIKCADSLGLENGKIPDSAMVASSEYNQYFGAERARLGQTTSGSYYGGWAPSSSNAGEWLQIDMGQNTKVTRIATQGRYDADWWVTSYTLAYKLDGGSYEYYQNGQVFTGNVIDRNSPVGNIIDPPIIARYIMIMAKTWKGFIALRVELYGCREGFSVPQPPPCSVPLGMQDNRIPDSALRASTSYNVNSMGPGNGRLHFQAGRGQYGAWAVSKNDEFQWFEIDFGNWTKVTRVATQGRQDGDWWVTKYRLSFSYDGVFYQDYKEDNYVKEFYGNSDRYTVVTHLLKNPIITRRLRINPIEWNSYISLRAEFYGCTTGFKAPVLRCQSPLGMKSGTIADRAITATSIYNQYYGPERARLDTTKEGNYGGAWLSKTNDFGQWIEVDLGTISKITRMATQGRSDGNNWVTSYSITFSVKGGPFLLYGGGQVITGNTNKDTTVGQILNPPIIAQYIRIHPKTWYTKIALRFELYGCTTGFKIPTVPACQIQLGMQNGKIPDYALSASSKYNSYYGPENARLHFQGASGRYPSWTPALDNHQQWIQVDFGVETQVTRIATQGNHASNYWTKTYTLRYGITGSYLRQYQPNGVTKTFQGNDDRYTVVSHDLVPPIRTRYLRVVPESWNGKIALRLEFYGCQTNDGDYSEWSTWSQCSASCGAGRKNRTRSCTNPPPSVGGKNCSGLGPNKEFSSCNEVACPVDGGYTGWKSYGECSKPCGGGVQAKHRYCTNPRPSNGGADCSSLGPDTMTRSCNNQNCPIDGGYGAWASWGKCSVSCGGGRRARRRNCNNPLPQFGGKDCSTLGNDVETEECGYGGCPVDGGYGSWGQWSKCSLTCGKRNGVKSRTRKCDNPEPQNGGADCSKLGKDTHTKPCKPKRKTCPVDGRFGAWSDWSDCSVTCGGGKQQRTRKCDSPKPSGGGRHCKGNSKQTKECNSQPCQAKWKPVGCYKNTDRALEDILLRAGNLPSIQKRYNACVKKADGKSMMVFGLDDKRCWSSKNAGKTYSKYGTSGQCKTSKGYSGGLTGSGTMFVYKKFADGWTEIGCYRNTPTTLALPNAFGTNMKRVSGADDIFEHCKAKADAYGYTAFGASDKGCWSGDDPTNTYDMFGQSDKCSVSKKTGNGYGREINGDMFVYHLDK